MSLWGTQVVIFDFGFALSLAPPVGDECSVFFSVLAPITDGENMRLSRVGGGLGDLTNILFRLRFPPTFLDARWQHCFLLSRELRIRVEIARARYDGLL
jgi:hypothetical protein